MHKPVRHTHFEGIEGAHFLKANGSGQQNVDYCTKEATRVGGPYTYGTPPPKVGQRTDIIKLRDLIRDGATTRELFDNDESVGPAARYLRAVDRMRSTYNPPMPREDIHVTFHYGPPGTGKTRCAFKEGAYFFDGNNGFWNGYNGESHVILDEFGGHILSPLMLQRLLDRYPLNLNIKGDSTPCNATNIHICSNYLPDQWWKEGTKFNRKAIYRRIHEVHYHNLIDECQILMSDEESTGMDKLNDVLRFVTEY